MENLYISSSETTPSVSFVPDKGHFEIKGESMSESPAGFYKPVIQWLEKYFADSESGKEITVDLRMEYFNSASSNSILDVLKVFEKATHTGFSIKIKWYYDPRDSDIKESGEEFRRSLDISSFDVVESS